MIAQIIDGIITLIICIGGVFFMFWLLQLFFRSIDKDIKKRTKELIPPEYHEEYEKQYYGLEDAFLNKKNK